MRKFEYDIVDTEGQHSGGLEADIQYLNDRGKEGWELIIILDGR